MSNALRLLSAGDRRLFGSSGSLAAPERPPAPRVAVFAAVDELMAGTPDAELAALREQLAALQAAGTPVILWSSGTRAEIEVFREQVAATGPFISEDGGAVFVPAGFFPSRLGEARQVAGYDVIELGLRYDQLIARIDQVVDSTAIRVTALNRMSIEDVATSLHLPLLRARLTKLREYTELLRVDDPRLASRGRLFRQLRTLGLRSRHDEPFDVVSGTWDKRAAVAVVQRLLVNGDDRLVSIGVGSKPQHLPVLHATDVQIIVPGRHAQFTSHLVHQAPLAHVVRGTAADGWLEALGRVHGLAGH